MCRNIVLTLFSLFLYIITSYGQSHGLHFLSHEVVQEKRTALDLTNGEPFCLDKKSEISFDLNFRPGHDIYFGYIIRIITGNNQNIDLVYNQRLRKFNFVIGETFSGEFDLDSASLYGGWNNFAVRLNEQSNEASFFLNRKYICKGKANLSASPCYRIYFGANDHERFQTVDIPPMNIKDVRINSGEKVSYHFPLDQSTGDQAKDIIGKKTAAVKNPAWIKPKHQNWQLLHAFETRGAASVAFDPNLELLYVVSHDSLYHLSIKNAAVTGIPYSRKRDTLPPGNQSVFDAAANSLYNFYIDAQKINRYNASARNWEGNFSPSLLTVYWQANKFLSSDTSLYVIGGYGQLTYKNTVQRYHFPSGRWQILQPKGDPFMPRYLAGLGVNKKRDTAYIIGGYGSSTGEQTINPKHNYDLMAFAVKDQSFHQVYHLKEPSRPFCFANSLVIDDASQAYYGLIYPNDRFNSVLQLIRGSLNEPVYTFMGDSIPYTFYDIKSFADLYYAPASKKLLAVTLYTEKNNITSVKVYTIDFPPNQLIEQPVKEDGVTKWWLLTGGCLLLITGALFLFRHNRKKKKKVASPENAELNKEDVLFTPPVLPVEMADNFPVNTPQPGSIFLFGQFEVFDREGTEITSRFTPLVKELFLLIVIYTFKDGKGISSEQLYELLWEDKPLKDARNNFSVNVVKLKHILEKVGDCQISRESGKWKIEILNDSIVIDFKEYMALSSSKQPVDKQLISSMIAVVGRGGFLPGVHYHWLDDIKSEVGSRVIDILLNLLQSPAAVNEPEVVVRLANTIFHFDQLNEEALVNKCRALIVLGRHGMAREAYLKYSKEYAENYGVPYEKSFAEISQL
jgi:DNA-binding SARP family transcriptional activator